MENKRGRPKGEQRFHVMLCLTKKEYEMLSAFAEREKRPKANAAGILLRNSLNNIFSGSNNYKSFQNQ
jgi:hypothetical protein